jgi:hypothetical protein
VCRVALTAYGAPYDARPQENNLSWFKGTSVLLVSNGLWVGNRRPCTRARTHTTKPRPKLFSDPLQLLCANPAGLTYGLRGVVQLSLQITGARKDLHSGIDGGTTRHDTHSTRTRTRLDTTEPNLGRRG